MCALMRNLLHRSFGKNEAESVKNICAARPRRGETVRCLLQAKGLQEKLAGRPPYSRTSGSSRLCPAADPVCAKFYCPLIRPKLSIAQTAPQARSERLVIRSKSKSKRQRQ